jgi:hypothetical protein|tara:strand:+ start:1031 stop:1354 length:324 start_codon:yes stop_codon:yes gene_type:complete
MAKVNVELGLTLKMQTGGGYNFFRPQVAILDIDIDGDVQDQIDRAIATVNEAAWPALETAMGRLVTQADVTDNESVILELGRKVNEMQKQLDGISGKGKAKDKDVKW